MSAQTSVHEIGSHLQSKGLPPTATWLTNFLAGQKSSVPLAALKQTAFFRMVQTDITQTIDRAQTAELPADIQDATIRERKLDASIVVQVLDVDDIGRSRHSQLEAIQSEERGETTKGREIVRVVPREDGEPETVNSNGPHKLLLQDARGAQVYAVELVPVDGIGIGMNIGSKLVLSNTCVARGVLLLEPKTVTVLGGRIDELHQKWKAGRKENLKAAAERSRAED